MSSPKKDWYRAARASGHYPLTFNFIFIRQDKYVQCSYCGVFIHEKALTRDHVYPKSRGGLIKTPACLSCNIAKEDMSPIEWALYATQEGIAFKAIDINYQDYMVGNEP
jgi:5-methylcytosine-specific restriction endonuclease McrA